RIRTNLEDVGSSISVLTEELLDDVGATDNQSALVYAVGMEVAGPRGNFSGVRQSVSGEPSQETSIANANANTRVRGLTSADNTRNYFLSDAPWDGYNVSRVDLQRGPNAILFGLGSPAGVVNASTDMATVAGNEGEVSVRFDQFGSLRGTINYNHVVLPDELAVRVAVLRDDEKFRQKPAYEEDERFYIAATYKPRFLNSGDSTFTLAGNYEIGDIESNRPRATTPLDYITPWWDIGQQTFNMYEGNAASTNATLNRGIYDPWVAELFRGGLRRV